MNLYSIELELVATAYIKANSQAEALKIAKGLQSGCLEVHDSCPDGDVMISGKSFDDPELPAVSLSPAMTIVGLASEHVELAQEAQP